MLRKPADLLKIVGIEEDALAGAAQELIRIRDVLRNALERLVPGISQRTARTASSPPHTTTASAAAASFFMEGISALGISNTKTYRAISGSASISF